MIECCENEYILLKSKDDFSFEHYKTSPMSQMTGFVGTAGEALLDSKGKITLFVDPRYHIQADIQTKGKNVEVFKMANQYGFNEYLKEFLKDANTLYLPSKSTTIGGYNKLKETLPDVEIKLYETKDDNSSIDDDSLPVFEVPVSISGASIKEKTEKIKLDNFLITNLEQIAYLLNLRSYKTKNTSTFRAKLFIQDKNPILFTDYNIPDIKIEVKPMSEFKSFLSSIFKPVFIDLSSISVYDYNLVQNPMPISVNPVVQMASVKNTSEINHFKDSFKRLDEALFSFRSEIKEGMSEFELNEIFNRELKKSGAYTTSFSTILAIDDNSSLIHYTSISKEKILKKGSVLLLDCGGYYEGGYATDITRVFWCKDEKADPLVKEIYTAVLKAQLNVYKSKDNEVEKLVKLSRDILDKYNEKGFYFPHGLGHGIGIPVHQSPPTLADKKKDIIEKYNVFTIEPGLYKEGAFGIRLENTVFMDRDKTSLSHFPYEEDLIDYNMLNDFELGALKEWQGYY